jgi:ADP-heptose:LPS heptosyltransferase/predicted SAM-dependent methyltransferase
MVWKVDGPQGNESGKVKWEIARWTRGRGLDLGCGMQKTYPHFIGVDNGKDGVLFGHPINPDVRVETAAQLPMFASGSMDFVFSSHLLEHFPLTADDPRKWPNAIARAMAAKMMIEKHTALEALREWMRVIKRGGNLVLYVPDEDEYPKVGTPGANPDHAFNVNYDVIIQLMRETGYAWDLIDFQKRNEGDEYSLYFVFQKVGGGCHESWKVRRKNREGKKTCGIVRYGAYGDLLQLSSVLHALHDEGYEVMLYTSPPGDDVIKHDPHVTEFYLQDKDQIPNHLLGDFWKHESKKYDKWVNLSESVEVTLLSVPGRTPHLWSPAARHRYMDHNYVEMQHAIASVPYVPRVRFYPTATEHEWANKERAKLGGAPLVMWALNGSSVHKTWGGLDRAIASILMEFPQAHIVMVGGPESAILEAGWDNESRVKCRAGKYSIRETMALLDFVDVVIGPETGVVNAASMLKIPKVVFLSHSSHNNLTRDWVNVYALASANTSCPGRGNNEAPACHQMHYSWEYCKQFREEGDPRSGTAQCQADIDGEGAWELIRRAIASTIPAELQPRLLRA